MGERQVNLMGRIKGEGCMQEFRSRNLIMFSLIVF